MLEKQEKFCVEFIKSGNAAEAYKAAGYKVTSTKSAANSASRLLENVGICSRIAELRAQLESEKIMDAKERRETLTAIARSRAEDAADRIRAIDTINKMDGVYISKVEVSGEIGIVDALKDARERLKNASK